MAGARESRMPGRHGHRHSSRLKGVRHAQTDSLRSEATATGKGCLPRLTFSFPHHGRACSTLFFHRWYDSNRLTLGGDPSVETAALHHLGQERANFRAPPRP
jgi:hypothetical protein